MIVTIAKKTLIQNQEKSGGVIAGAVGVATIGAGTARPGKRDTG